MPSSCWIPRAAPKARPTAARPPACSNTSRRFPSGGSACCTITGCTRTTPRSSRACCRACARCFGSLPNASRPTARWAAFPGGTSWIGRKRGRGGVPPPPATGNSAPLDLQLLLAYQWAAEMEAALGKPVLADEDRQAATRLRESARRLYWDADRHLFADTPAAQTSKRAFSQQSNALAVLAGVAGGSESRDLIERVAGDQSLVQCSIYFRHYLHSAMNKAGAGDRYLDMLGPWRAMLERGLTTWAETADPTRSDCHAWGASPNYELIRTVLGIDSAAPGFARVAIRPFLGKLTHVSGAIPHPKGEIAVRLTLENGKLEAGVTLPAGVDGQFEWHGQTRELHPGENRLML